MLKLTWLWTAGALALGVAGCVSPQQQAAQKEDLLAAAGFQVRPADSPHRIEAMKEAAAQQVSHQGGERQSGLFVCRPARLQLRYFGTQQNWDAYKQEMFAKQLADEAQMTAIMTQGDWDGDPWGWP